MIKRLHSTLFYANNIKATAKFYEQLGFTVEKGADTVKVSAGGGSSFGGKDFRLVFTNEHTTLIQNESGAEPKGLGIFTYVEVADVDAYAQWLKKQGVRAATKPRDWPWGKREFVVKDPDGYKLVFFSSL